MNVKIKVNRSVLDILSEFDHATSQDQHTQRIHLLHQLANLTDDLPHPASGRTYQRWQYFSQVGSVDLSLAKLFESHCDAVSILHELGYSESEQPKGLLAVWAAEGGAAPLQVEDNHCCGTKAWCSGAAFIQHALMSYKNPQGQSQLCMVELNQPSVAVDLSQWDAVGMQATQTAQVHFQDTPIQLIGQANDYLQRVGFWHGAAGVAACWYGAAAGLMIFLQNSAQESPNPFKQMYLGELAQQLAVTQQYFQYTAQLIDAQPTLSHEREVRILRAQTEQCCLRVIELVGKALGARPFCESSRFAKLMADLPVFIRQSHAAFDHAQIATLYLQEQSRWEL